MEGFLRMKEDLDKIIQNDFEIFEDDDDPTPAVEKPPSSASSSSASSTLDSSSPSPSKTPEASSPPPPPPAADSGPEPPFGEKLVAFCERSNLRQFIETNLFQVCIILLVVLDCIFVILELMVDLGELYGKGEWKETGWALFFHVASFLILNIFMIEIGLKIYVYQRELLTQKFEIFDAVVVLVAWCLDIALLVHDGRTAVIGVQLLIVLRLWRVARIVNGIIQGVRTRSHAKLKKQKDHQTTLAAENDQLKLANSKLEEELTHLRTVARKYGVPESSLQRFRTSSNNNSFDNLGVAAKKAEVAVVQMTQESEFL